MASPVASDLVEFAARFGNKVLQEQVKLRAPIWSALEHIPMSGQVGIVNPIVAAQSSSTFVADGGDRPVGNARTPVQGIMSPAFVTASLKLNNGTLAVLSGKQDSANYLDGELKSCAGTMAKQIGQGILGAAGLICSITAIVEQFGASVAGRAIFTVDSAAGLAIGLPITLNDVSASRSYIVRVGAIELSGADATANVTLINDVELSSTQSNNTNAVLAAVVFAANDTLNQRGSFTNEGINSASAASSLGCVSLSDLSGSGAVYSLSSTDIANTGFRGQQFTSVGTPTQEAFIMRMMRMRQLSGEGSDLIVVNPMTAGVLGFGALTQAAAVGAFAPTGGIGQTRRMVDGKLDKYGAGIMGENGVSIGGVKTVSDENLAEGTAYILNTEYTKIGKWQDIEAEKEGSDVVLVNRDKFAKEVFYGAIFNVYCNKRSTVGRLTGLTTDLL